MKIINLMNYLAMRKRLRPLGSLVLWIARILPFSFLVKISGRRIVAAFAGAPAILLSSLHIGDAVEDANKLYKATTYTVKTMRLDMICLFADMSLEAEACGCQVQLDDDRVPSVKTHVVKTRDDLIALKIPDPYKDGRMPVFLETMRLLKMNFTMLKVGEVSGPFTLATSLGGSDIYMDIRRNAEKVKALLEYCEKVIIRYGQALIKSGADILLIAEPAGSQLSSSNYEEFSLDYTRKIISSFNRPCALHICGKAGHIVQKMCLSGAVALSLDDVDINQVIKSVPRKIVIIGNISPSKFSKASPEEIKTETCKLIDSVKTRKEFMFAPGCDLSPNTPLENVLSFVDAVKNYHG